MKGEEEESAGAELDWGPRGQPGPTVGDTRGGSHEVEQRHHQVQRLDELMLTAERQTLGIGQGHLELACHFVNSHGNRLRLSRVFPRIALDSGLNAIDAGWVRHAVRAVTHQAVPTGTH